MEKSTGLLAIEEIEEQILVIYNLPSIQLLKPAVDSLKKMIVCCSILKTLENHNGIQDKQSQDA